MLVGVISDTHGHVEFTREAVRVLESLQVDRVIHCGDVGSPRIPELLEAWPVHYVAGNIDRDPLPLEHAMVARGHVFHGLQAELLWADSKIAVLHGHDAPRLQAAIDSQHWDLVCCGHTHRYQLRRVGRTTVLNPGALYRATPHSFALVQLPELEVNQIVV